MSGNKENEPVVSSNAGSQFKKSFSVKEDNDSLSLSIPAKGFKGKGLITLIVIGFWMVTIFIWTIILLFMKPVNALYSIPFWAIGVHTLVKSLKMIRLEQAIEISGDSLIYKAKRGNHYDEKQFNIKDVKVSLVEGSYYTYSGLNKRGHYPAIIKDGEAFSFAERLSIQEKHWLVGQINTKMYLNAHSDH